MRKKIMFLVVIFFKISSTCLATDTSFVATVVRIEKLSGNKVKLVLVNEFKDSVYFFTGGIQKYSSGQKVQISFNEKRSRKRTIISKASTYAKLEII